MSLKEMFEEVRAAFERLTPTQQTHVQHTWRIDFAAGNVALSWPEPPLGAESNLDKARRLIRERIGPCPCGECDD